MVKLMLTDSRLVEQARNGDRRAYEELVRRHQDRVFRFALYMLPSWQDAEDVSQDTFVEAYKGLKRFRGDASFGTWILAIARTRIAYWYRSRRPEDPVDEVPEIPVGGSGSSLITQMEIRSAVARLPETYREIIVLKYVNELDMQEIAAATGLSLTAVGVRLHRARNMLRTALSPVVREEECYDEM